jgi:lipoprotein-releasing system ATP-binding protein
MTNSGTTEADTRTQPAQSTPLSCHGLHRYLGEFESRVHVLRGITLDVAVGSVHSVVGPSGCGKSTLLYVLGLLDAPDEGQITIGGEDVSGLTDNELSQKRNELIGFVFQFHFLMHEFTALENVMIPMRRLGRLTPRDMRERAGALLDAVGLGNKLERLADHLSGGEQQRVAIARSLANDPKILLADEPTGNLDTENSERVFRLLTELVKREQKALLLATHNPLIARASDIVHEMKDGVIVRSEAPVR